MTERIKLLFIIPSLETGGAQRVLSILLQYISKDIFDITLCVLTDTGIFYDSVPASVKKINLNISRVRYSGLKIYRLIKCSSPDIVFVFDVNNLLLIVGLLSLLLSSRIKYITREVVVLSIFIKSYAFFKRFRQFLYRLMFKRFHLIICQSNYMRNDLIVQFNVSKTKAIVIHNPVDIQNIIHFSNSNEFLLKRDSINLIAVGRIVYVKGFDILIEALKLVKEPSVHLTILGEETPESPGYYDKLLRLIKQYDLSNKVTLLGFQSNPYKYIKQSDFMIISSRTEAFPNVALESIALNVPVISFDCPGGIGEIIENNVNGWLVENGNFLALAQAIDSVVQNRVKKSNISKSVTMKNDVSIIMTEYEASILKLLGLGYHKSMAV